MGGGEGLHGPHGTGPLVHDEVGGNRDAGVVEHGPHAGLVDRQLQGLGSRPDHGTLGDHLPEDLQVDLLVVEGHDVAARRQGPEVPGDEGRSEHHLGRHRTGGLIRAFGQHRHGQAQRADRLTRHARQLTSPDEPDRVGAQVARPRAGIRLDSGADTTADYARSTRDMAGPLRIGSMIEVDKPLSDIVAVLRRYRDAGLDHAFASQIFGPDALTLLAVAGSQVPDIGLGTGVVPVYPRHPMMLAQQALTVQAATGNRLLLGIGLSHQVVVEGMWGISYERPAAYMKEYLTSLMPLLHGETVRCEGERVTTNAFAPLDIADVEPPPVLVAALGDTMLKLAGRVADGTITWMTGTGTVGGHIAPTITAAAEAAGRPAPRVVVSLPIAVTNDPDTARARMNEAFAIYPNLPAYKAMLDKEGAAAAADIGFIGDEAAVAASIAKLADAGATDFVAAVVGDAAERARGLQLLSEIARA